MLVERRSTAKIPKTLNLPPEIITALDRMTLEVNGKQKWVVYSAAVIFLLEASDEERDRVMNQVSGADVSGTFNQIIAAAKALHPRRLSDAPPRGALDADGKYRMVIHKQPAEQDVPEVTAAQSKDSRGVHAPLAAKRRDDKRAGPRGGER